MAVDALRRPGWLRWVAFGCLWTLIAVAFASQFYFSSSQFGRAVTWAQALSYALGDWYVWAVLSLPIFWMARRFRVEGRRWAWRLAIHALASVVASVIYVLLRAWVATWQSPVIGEPAEFAEIFKPLLVKTWPYNLLIYWVLVTVRHAFDYYRRLNERERRTLELEKSLTDARLQALQMQLNPHFLFNTLHSISSLMHKDVEAADRTLALLADLLRQTLAGSGTQEVSLRQELSFLSRYLEIEQTRFGDRLQVRLDIAPETLDALVPSLILQPLVENAIRHGIERSAGRGIIELSAKASGQSLVLEVSDNGPGFQPQARPGQGIGLANTRERLGQLYGEAQQLAFSSGPDGGLRVHLSMPFRVASQPVSAVVSEFQPT